MKTWQPPIINKYTSKDLSKIIKARAWSVNSGYEMGSYLDEANVGMCGTVYMDFNPGHAIQVEVIGRVIIGGYIIVTLVTEYGETYSYQKPEYGGIWERR